MGWQILLLQQLRSAGVPIEGLTIGAGVPSIEVANEYIEAIGLKHISFNPGSIDAIQQVINIAKANPTFPVILQWTGGRGGGRHSFEDFHQPILQMYARIRRCDNIALVAGSGFGGELGPRSSRLGDKDWGKTYKGPAGGVITVRSEMGEPIHKLVTRGVRLCGEAVDLEDITYAEVIRRMVELMYVKHESRWIHPSLKRLTGGFIRRIEERFTSVEGLASLFQNYADLDDPFATTEKILAHYPEANTQLINAQDMQHFLLLYLEAVVDQDVGRTWILQGAMAAKHSTVVNEPIKDILDGIHNGDSAALTTDCDPVVEYFGGKPITSLDDIEKIDELTVSKEGGKTTFRLSASASQGALPDADQWLRLLAGETYSWRYALFTSDVFVQGNKFQNNPMRRIFAPAHGMVVEMTNARDPARAVITVKEKRHSGGCNVKTVNIRMLEENEILIDLIKERTMLGKPASLPLRFRYHPETSSASIRETVYAPMDFAIVLGWKAIIKAIFPKAIDGDLLKLVHLSNSFRMPPGAELFKKDDVVETRAQINAVLNQVSGKIVEVCGTISSDGRPIMEVTSQFLYRGTYADCENTFQRKVETLMQVHMASSRGVAVLRSKEWFHLDDPDTELLGKTLTFRLSSFIQFKDEKIFSSVETLGQVLVELPTKEVIQVASIQYIAGQSHGNPVIDYHQRHGTSIEQPVNFDNAIPLNGKTELLIRAPASNEGYARVSGDYNLIYTNIARVRYFSCSFVGMLLPNDDIETKLHHAGLVSGRKIIKVEATNKETQEKVLVGEAEVEQRVSAYLFTGQGSQEQGMGMSLYDSSPVAREVWDRADRNFMDNYGFAITNIVRNSPKELTVHFGGPRGKAIRQNYRYMSMTFGSAGADGSTKSEKIFQDVTEATTSYTYRSPTWSFKASFEDVGSRDLFQRDFVFAGHSWGGCSALAALAEVMPIGSLVSVVFYRGFTMQVAVERDTDGRSNYSMIAVNPSRISKTFKEQALQYVVDNIAEKTKWLLEVVNYNVINQQYVCAGDLRALDWLTNVLNFLKVQKIDIQALMAKMSLEDIVRECAKQTEAKPKPVELQCGLATILLRGIGVPFHSTFLRSGVKPFRIFLMKKIVKSSIGSSKLVLKYIPNVTAKPFQLTKEYFEDVYKLTNSPRIGQVLANWDKHEDPIVGLGNGLGWGYDFLSFFTWILQGL
ncbi:fatty acid synthase beta subunit [Tuber borchii]|uniref:Fatty acid synthase beta subunit n=1 Tax=Tuber borchii TaxID=42251 RepID=A0A2T6ZSF7_TUBBO|nr:fatty acid synthase beta subunit [Tuber borchii]